jgi:hypothetical protein
MIPEVLSLFLGDVCMDGNVQWRAQILRDLTTRLQRVRIRGEIVEGDQRELVGRQVEVVVVPVQVQRNIEASTAGRSPLSIETPFILSPLAASRLGTQRLSEPGTNTRRKTGINDYATKTKTVHND